MKKLRNIYPSAVVSDGEGGQTTISIEWYQENSKSVELLGYALIYLYQDGSKEEHFFKNYEEMIEAIKKLQKRYS